MSEEKLSAIQDLLEDIRAILMLSNNDKIQEAKKQLLKEGSQQKKICDLCDGKATQEIAAILQKTPNYVDSNISLLRRKGLVKTVEKNGKKVHDQRF